MRGALASSTTRLVTGSTVIHCIRPVPLLPFLCPRSSRSFASKNSKAKKIKAAGTPPLPLPTPPVLTPETTVQLRSYQEECIQSVLTHIDEGHRRMGISLATGSGKTVIFTQLISRLTHPNRPDEATQTLILAHRTELVQQAFNHCRQTYPSATIEIEMAESHASGMADITIASIQSIASRDRIEKYDPTKFKLVLIDEAHHAVASRYLETLDHFGVLKMNEGLPEEKPIVVGVSATMSRFDGLKLGKVIDYIVYHRDYVDMIKENWLCPVIFTTVQTNVDLSRVRNTSTGEFNTGDLGLAVNTDPANEVTVRSWLEKARGRKSTIVFCVDVAHVHEMVAKFRHYGVDARPITGTTAAITRKERLNSFRRGEFKVLVNCGVFTEGTDIPNIDCVLLARPTKSKNLLVQMIGRGMRLHPGKTDCYVLDMMGNVERGIVTVPTLMGLDPDEVLEDETMEDATKRAERQEEQRRKLAETNIDVQLQSPESTVPGDATVTFTHYSSVYDLIADGKSERYIRSLSRLAWVEVGADRYILPNKNGDITISRANDKGEGAPVFTVTETRALPAEVTGNRHVKSRPRTLASNLSSLESALHAADTYAVNKYPRALLIHRAPWRRNPASEGQLKFLEKIKGKDPELQNWRGLGEELSKGQAMDMITKIKHGAATRFEKLGRERKKEEKETRKIQELRMREWVAVGAVDGGSVAEGKGRGVS